MADEVKGSMERDANRQRGLTRGERWSAPMPFTPFTLARQFADEMDRMFENIGWPITGRRRGLAQGGWSPQIEMFERGGNLIVRADLPGMKREDVEVEVREDMLTIQGERRHEQEEEREGYYHSERSYGRFYRSIPLPDGVDPDQVSASFQDGVLEIRIPVPERSAERQGRRIEIR